MTQEFDFSPLQDAGLTQLEFAALLGVSRVTVNLWVAGKMRPHQYIRSKVVLLLTAIRKATQHGFLPLPRPHAKDRRIELIKTALRSAAQLSAPALIAEPEATV
jgi:transcriptional regulator with XRE-family HTH domain